MLTKQECMLLNSCHSDYYGYGVSPVDATLGVIAGRPYGGVGFLWKKCLDASSSIWTGTEHNISYAYLSHVKPMECQPNDP